MKKSSKLKCSIMFQAILVSMNMYLTFYNISKDQIEYAGFSAAVCTFCLIGALGMMAELTAVLMKEENG